MSDHIYQTFEGLVPRGLLRTDDIQDYSVNNEGLCAVRIKFDGNKISFIERINHKDTNDAVIVLPRLLEPHTHLDKAFTWNNFPNLKGTYTSALAANFEEHKSRTYLSVKRRLERALGLALENGIRAVRTHVDSFGYLKESTWQAFSEIKLTWKKQIDLQLVALVPIEYWSTSGGKDLALKISELGGLLGGVLVPPFNHKTSNEALCHLLDLADQLNCGIDLHIDESHIEPAAGLRQLLKVLHHKKKKLNITCSHCSSMGLLSQDTLNHIAEKLSEYGVKVIALPLTNAWLLGRKQGETPVQRPFAPIRQLQAAGVSVAVGGDNVQDAWFPAGCLDPLALMSSSLPIAQLAPWERLGLAPFTTAASRVMDLTWDGTIFVGAPADLIVLNASSWAEALASPPKRKVLINGKWLINNNLSQKEMAGVKN